MALYLIIRAAWIAGTHLHLPPGSGVLLQSAPPGSAPISVHEVYLHLEAKPKVSAMVVTIHHCTEWQAHAVKVKDSLGNHCSWWFVSNVSDCGTAHQRFSGRVSRGVASSWSVDAFELRASCFNPHSLGHIPTFTPYTCATHPTACSEGWVHSPERWWDPVYCQLGRASGYPTLLCPLEGGGGDIYIGLLSLFVKFCGFSAIMCD